MYKEKFDLKDKVIIITGGAGLIGKEYTKALSEVGAHAVVADINGEAAQKVASNVDGAKALGIEIDVTHPESIGNMIQRVMSEFGRIDGLVNNAALDPKFDKEDAGKHTNSFEEFPLEMWRQALDVNLTGMFLCAQAVAPIMLEQGNGAIVNISSTYGIVSPDQRLYEKDDPQAPKTYKPITYSVTKGAVFNFTRYLATYWAEKGIRVNTLSLGGVYNNHDEEFVKKYSQRTPMTRMAKKEEYCGALIFLLSDASSYMTGSNLVVDGGWTAW